MNFDDFELNFKKLKEHKPEFEFVLNPGLEEVVIHKHSKLLNLAIPLDVLQFYQRFNGLITKTPNLEILKMEYWGHISGDKLKFAEINGLDICFKTRQLNSADQWTIVNGRTDYEITLTMNSFWSNKIWRWLKMDKEFWENE